MDQREPSLYLAANRDVAGWEDAVVSPTLPVALAPVVGVPELVVTPLVPVLPDVPVPEAEATVPPSSPQPRVAHVTTTPTHYPHDTRFTSPSWTDRWAAYIGRVDRWPHLPYPAACVSSRCSCF